MLFRLTAISAALALAACGQGSEANNQVAGNDADPALTSALEDQILTDPNLAQQSNGYAVRPPETPTRAEYPVDYASSDRRPPVRRANGTSEPTYHPPRGQACTGCPGSTPPPSATPGGRCAGAEFRYGMEWAQRLPAAFPPYPGGRVTEAAGHDRGDCRIRVVTFRTADPHQRVIHWYHQRAVQSGYSAERQARGSDHVLGGVNQATEGAYYLVVTPVRDGSEVALIVNNGR